MICEFGVRYARNSNTQPSEPIGCPKAPVLVKDSSCTKNVEGTDCSSPSENTVEELGERKRTSMFFICKYFIK